MSLRMVLPVPSDFPLSPHQQSGFQDITDIKTGQRTELVELFIFKEKVNSFNKQVVQPPLLP